MHTPTEPVWGMPLFLWAVVALSVVFVLVDPWRKALLSVIPDWCIVVFCIVSGLALNWAWAYSWFDQHLALTSGPVLLKVASFVALNALVAFLAALLHTRRRWQLGAAYFLLASIVTLRLFHR